MAPSLDGLVPEQIRLPEHALLLEELDRFIDRLEHAVGGLGDERARVFLRLPDDVHILAVLEGVLELALDARGKPRDTTRKFWNE